MSSSSTLQLVWRGRRDPLYRPVGVLKSRIRIFVHTAPCVPLPHALNVDMLYRMALRKEILAFAVRQLVTADWITTYATIVPSPTFVHMPCERLPAGTTLPPQLSGTRLYVPHSMRLILTHIPKRTCTTCSSEYVYTLGSDDVIMCTRCHPTSVPRDAPIHAVGQPTVSLPHVWATIDHPHPLQHKNRQHRHSRRTKLAYVRDRLDRAMSVRLPCNQRSMPEQTVHVGRPAGHS